MQGPDSPEGLVRGLEADTPCSRPVPAWLVHHQAEARFPGREVAWRPRLGRVKLWAVLQHSLRQAVEALRRPLAGCRRPGRTALSPLPAGCGSFAGSFLEYYAADISESRGQSAGWEGGLRWWSAPAREALCPPRHRTAPMYTHMCSHTHMPAHSHAHTQ